MKARICLMGRHANRTPFAYDALRPFVGCHFEYCDTPENADFLAFGFRIDIHEHAQEIHHLRRLNPELKILVVSEEPLWDSLWGGKFWKRQATLQTQDIELEYINLNHVTSSLYDFDNFPYFLTTDDRFFVRYSHYFKRNARLGDQEILQLWKDARIRFAFYAEKRIDPRFIAQFPEHGILVITNLRSQIAAECKLPGTLRVGKGWGEFPLRQSLPDWHLDKLSTLDRCSWIVGAMENTCHDCYITEKIFDAYAVLGVPICFAAESSKLNRLVDMDSLINCYNLDIAQACDRLSRFEADPSFVDCYRNTMARLDRLFSSPGKYIDERNRFATALAAEIGGL